MEILQLRYFFDSAKNESFAKTAEKYQVPATSVSASVKRLEAELGCKLFHRANNRIMLNDNGKRLQNSLFIIFEELESAVYDLSAISTDTREIKMLVRAMRGTITNYIIEYKEKHPHVSFKTVFDFDETDFKKYDIIIDDSYSNYPGYERINLYTSKLCLRVAADSPLCNKKLTLKQLCNHPFISIGENNGMNKILINACEKAGFKPDIVVQSNDIYCTQKCVEAGVGIGLGRVNFHLYKSKKIKQLNVTDFNETQTICGYYRKQSAYGNIEHFINFLKEKTV